MSTALFPPPKVTFQDANGAPLAGGLVYFYEPDTVTPKDTYSDYAGSVVNTNPVVLDSRGEANIRLDGRYDVVVKDSGGSTVYTYDDLLGSFDSLIATHTAGGAAGTVSDNIDRHEGYTLAELRAIASPQAGKLYRVVCADGTYDDAFYDSTGTDSDKDTNPAALGGGNWRRTSVLNGYIKARKIFGITTSGDSATKLQDAINESARLGIGCYLRGDRAAVQFGTPLYFQYDAVNNPEFPSGNYQGGRVRLFGDHPGDTRNLSETSQERGSLLEYTGSTGNAIVVGDGTSNGAKRVMLDRLAIRAATSGNVIDMDYAPHSSVVRDLTLYNSHASGGGLNANSIWSCVFEYIDIWGDPTAASTGTGFIAGADAGSTGGGNNTFRNINAGYFADGLQFGNPYDATNGGLPGSVVENIQGSACGTGIKLLHGFSGVVIGPWTEANTVAGLQISDSCGGVDIRGGRFVEVDAATTASILLGRSSGTVAQAQYGIVRIGGGSLIYCKNAGIRRYAQPGYLSIEDTQFNNNGGFGIHTDTADYGGIRFGEHVQFTGFSATTALRVGRGTVGSPVATPQFVRGAYDLPDVGAASVDFTNLRTMPEAIEGAPLSNNVTILLPDDYSVFQGFGMETVFTKTAGTYDLILDAGTGNYIGSGGSQTITLAAPSYDTFTRLIPTIGGGGTRIDWKIVGG